MGRTIFTAALIFIAVRIRETATTEPKSIPGEKAWDGSVEGIWDIPSANFTSQKVTRKFAGIRKESNPLALRFQSFPFFIFQQPATFYVCPLRSTWFQFSAFEPFSHFPSEKVLGKDCLWQSP